MIARPSHIRSFLACCALAIFLACENETLAAPDEIAVYTDEINAPGKFSLEQHINYTIKGTQTPDYPGQMTSNHVMQVTPELAYGINKNFEVSLYMPLAFTPDGNAYINALRFHIKYIAPKANDEPFFYGLSTEFSRESVRTSNSSSGLELRPIIGYRDENWLASFNPILGVGLADNVSHQPQFAPALKLTHRMDEDMHGGIEYYGTYGPLNQMLPAGQRGHTLYAVLDTEMHGLDINFGIGRGFVNTGDDWVAKSIISLPL